MADVRTVGPDFKVFLRRLVVPGEIAKDLNSIPLASQVAGLALDTQGGAAKLAINAINRAVNETGSIGAFSAGLNELLGSTFANYQPADFRDKVVAKAATVAKEFVEYRASKKAQLNAVGVSIRHVKREIALLTIPVDFVGPHDPRATANTSFAPLPTELAVTLKQEAAYFSGPKDSAREINELFVTKLAITSAEKALGDLSAVESNYISDIKSLTDALSTKNLTEDDAATFRSLLASDLNFFIALRAPSLGNRDQLKLLNNLLSTLQQNQKSLIAEVANLESVLPLRPFYEPILLNCLIGPQSVTTSGNRMGQPGTASVSFHLPLASNGQAPDLFMGFNTDEVFSLSMIEGKIGSGKSIPNKTMSILKPNMRETTIQPFDMIQIWGRRKLTTGATFPGDYYPVFTGFITKTGVNYSGSAVTVTVAAEDVGKQLRLARINVDPNLDTRFNPAGINVSLFNNVLQSPQFKSGADLIEGMIVGAPGTMLGLSQAEILEKVEIKQEGSQTIPTFTPRTRIVSLATDFQNIKLNLFKDLANQWPPYARQIKSAVRLWETDARNKFDICREIADITEFEFYVDSMGVVNYHPPLYFLNPFAAQYFIEDVDIENESHNVDEAEVLTVVEVHSQPSGIPDTTAINAGRANDSIVAAADSVIQRYGVRWQKKSVPILSGTEIVSDKTVDPKLKSAYARDSARDGYARSWLNRRNARLRSATVTITGTPEIRLCNTVAFVGNMQQSIKTVATNQIVSAAVGLLGSAFSSLLKGYSPAAKVALDSVMVYYVSSVTHNYVQGGRFTTTLALTHGRHWTDPLPQGSVGYSIDPTDNDKTLKALRDIYGQDGIDADAYVREVNNKIQFIASGNPAFLAPQDSSQFGLTARPVAPSILSKARSALSSEIKGAVDKVAAGYCVVLGRARDPKKVEKKAKTKSQSMSKSLSNAAASAKKAIADAYNQTVDFLSKKAAALGDKIAKLLEKITVEKLKKEAIARARAEIDKLEEKALDAIMGGQTLKITSTTAVTAGGLVPEAVLAPFKTAGVDVSPITSFPLGLVVYTYISRSNTSLDEAMSRASLSLLDDAGKKLSASNAAQLKILIDSVLDTTTITKPNIGGQSKNVYFITGVMAIGLEPNC